MAAAGRTSTATRQLSFAPAGVRGARMAVCLVCECSKDPLGLIKQVPMFELLHCR